MCRLSECATCHKMTWTGCGQHIDAALSRVALGDRCPGWRTGHCTGLLPSEASIMHPKVVILPGNGCADVYDANWYAWMKERLGHAQLFSEIILEDMPDPYVARESIWIPFILNELKVDEHTIVIGHSSGAVAALRLLEQQKVLGLVLVSVCHTDLGDENERLSGYFNRPFDWEKICSNANWILQYHSSDDPLIPIYEADFVAEKINSNYRIYNDKSHFFRPNDVTDVVTDIISKVIGGCESEDC